MRTVLAALVFGLIATGAVGVAAAEPGQIEVAGVGHVRTAPDLATATLAVRGEGATPDAATRALVKKLEDVHGGIAGLPKVQLDLKTSEMKVLAVRGENCASDYDTAQLSTGPCAIKGYLATMDVKVTMSPPEEVGTMLGLATRLGADSSNTSSFDLKDPTAAQQQATALALADAQKKARTIAEGAGARLGAILKVTDSIVIEMGVTPPPGTVRKEAVAGAPSEPVPVIMRPDAVVTTAQLVVTYAILP